MKSQWRRIVVAVIGSVFLVAAFCVLGSHHPLKAALSQASDANPRDVVFNEVAWSGTAASANDEWIELYNATDQPVDLTGWHIEASNNGPDIDLSGAIQPHGYFILERTDNNTLLDVPANQVYGTDSSTWALNNSPAGEALTLTAQGGVVIDTANADEGSWPAGSGTPNYGSMERVDPAGGDIGSNWATNTGSPRNGLDASGDPINGTPGFRNSVSSPAADLVATKGGPAHAPAQTDITYTLQMYNLGNIVASGATLTDRLPLSTTFVTSTYPYPTEIDDHTLVWDLGDLPINASGTPITVVAHIAAGATDPLINHITGTVTVTEAAPFNNTAACTTTIQEPAAALNLVKTGPALAAPAVPLTYQIAISNTGNLAANGVIVTDTLPDGLIFITQTAPYPCTRPDAQTIVWTVGSLAPNASGRITLTLNLGEAPTHTLTNLATATDSAGDTGTAAWDTPILPRVLLYALQPGNYASISGEAAALINLSPYDVDLSGWCLDDKEVSGTRVCFPGGAQIATGQILWLAERADGFYPIWGFDADWAGNSLLRPVSLLTGSWPGFSDTGEAAYLLDATGAPVDVLVYGTGAASGGWTGTAVPHPYAGYDARGQVLYRKLDQSTGRPVPDTNSAADWAQDPNDPTNGRKLRYPGWDLETLFFPVEITQTAHITVAVAPDAMLDVVSQTVASAQKSLIIEGYTLGSVPLYEVIQERVQAGVVVTALLESGPAGGMSDDERWVAQQLHNPPASTVYFIGGSAARYRFQHAKFMVIDDRLALISTDNFGESSMPSDTKVNGTMGHRGFVAVTDSPDVIAHLKTVFRLDCDPDHHIDIFPYWDYYAPPDYYVPIPPFDWTTYTVAFSPTLVATATHITLMHSPEHSLRDQDALLGLIHATHAGSIDAMQMSEPVTWTDGVGAVGHNPRIEALVAAAERGVHVRLLLDAYYDDPLADNTNTAACLYLNGLHLPDLQCRLANVTGLGIHAKIFLVNQEDEQWVHLGSINGSEGANKVNRELAIQFNASAVYDDLAQVFEHDWELGHGPMVYRVYLPLVVRDYAPPADYPLITEVMVNPLGEDGGKEWIEVYNASQRTVTLSGWTLGDAINVGDYGDGRYSFPAGAQLLPKQVIVVAACATQFAAQYGFNPSYEWTNCEVLVPDMIPSGAWEGFGLALGNVSDEVLLQNAGSAIVDSLAWGGAPRAGVVPYPMDVDSTFPWDATLKRYPPDYDHDDCARDFYISYTASPGRVSGAE